jgi:phage tail-like protein
VSPYAPADRKPARDSRARLPDPVPELGFKVEITGIDGLIGWFAECSGLTAEYEILEYQEGGENRYTRKLRGRLKYPNLVLKRGVTYEGALLDWLFKIQTRKERGNLTLTLTGPDGKDVRKWAFAEAFPVKWTGPTLNAGSNNVATETLDVAHAGFVFPLER